MNQETIQTVVPTFNIVTAGVWDTHDRYLEYKRVTVKALIDIMDHYSILWFIRVGDSYVIIFTPHIQVGTLHDEYIRLLNDDMNETQMNIGNLLSLCLPSEKEKVCSFLGVPYTHLDELSRSVDTCNNVVSIISIEHTQSIIQHIDLAFDCDGRNPIANNIVFWNGTEMQTIHENILINHEFPKWLRTSNSIHDSKCVDIQCGKNVLYLILLPIKNAPIDPMFQVLFNETFNGVVFAFTKLESRNGCMIVLQQLLQISTLGVCLVVKPIEDSDVVSCRCGGKYDYKRIDDHFNTKLHNRWVKMIRELAADMHTCDS
jgi:hypothetical protein